MTIGDATQLGQIVEFGQHRRTLAVQHDSAGTRRVRHKALNSTSRQSRSCEDFYNVSKIRPSSSIGTLSNEMADSVHVDVRGPLLKFARDCDQKAATYDWLEGAPRTDVSLRQLAMEYE